MPEFIDILNVANSRDVIHRAVAMLADGALIGLATESVYVLVAHGLQGRSVEKLATLRTSEPETILALCLKGLEEVQDFLPDMGPLAKRQGWKGRKKSRLTVFLTFHLTLLTSFSSKTGFPGATSCLNWPLTIQAAMETLESKKSSPVHSLCTRLCQKTPLPRGGRLGEGQIHQSTPPSPCPSLKGRWTLTRLS